MYSKEGHLTNLRDFGFTILRPGFPPGETQTFLSYMYDLDPDQPSLGELPITINFDADYDPLGVAASIRITELLGFLYPPGGDGGTACLTRDAYTSTTGQTTGR